MGEKTRVSRDPRDRPQVLSWTLFCTHSWNGKLPRSWHIHEKWEKQQSQGIQGIVHKSCRGHYFVRIHGTGSCLEAGTFVKNGRNNKSLKGSKGSSTSLVVDNILYAFMERKLPRSWHIHEKWEKNKSLKGSNGSVTSLFVDIILYAFMERKLPRSWHIRKKWEKKQQSQGIHGIDHKYCRGHYFTSRDNITTLHSTRLYYTQRDFITLNATL